jgi:putative flippase GtrA
MPMTMTALPAAAATTERAGKGLLDRLLTGRVAAMLARNTMISCLAFLLDIALLWALVEHLGANTMPAAAFAFLIASSLHYGFCRSWVFKGTSRSVGSGYAYFLLNAAIGLALTLALFWAFMALDLHYLLARIVASVFAGLTVFVLNAVWNFRIV